MQKIFMLCVFVLLYITATSNNIKVGGEAKVVGFSGDTAIVEVNISWNNSWRDDFNWDAAWIFLKYKKRGVAQEWHPAYLTREGNEAIPESGNEGGGYSFMFGEVGSGANAKITGLFLMRDRISDGKVNALLRIKWPLKANSKLALSPSDFGTDRDQIYLAAYAVETVYVPFGSYYLGDNHSNGTFALNGSGPIPAIYDVIDNKSGYAITASGSYDARFLPTNAADRTNNPIYPTGTWYHHTTSTWWQIDFKTEKMIRYFGLTGPTNYPTNYFPTATWYLKGSNDNVNWSTLSTLAPSQWRLNTISYPMQHSIKVTNPGNYRYYKLDFPTCIPGILVQNIAMSENELYPNGFTFKVEGEEAITLGTNLVAKDAQTWSGTLSAAYPKGYRGYYMMKYEVSQEQYVEFLNSLTANQQKKRVANSDFARMQKGDYAFGDLKRPNNRNGIAFLMLKEGNGPAVFGNNLNPENDFFALDDGQTLACNYLSPLDMLAYCDWSGLRPMSEMEYEKACRRPYPQTPEEGEYAWNANTGVSKLLSEGELNTAKTETEVPGSSARNVNAGGGLSGPVRCGAFTTGKSSQLEAGATYWGVMEMSGNLWEMCYNANSAGAKFVGNDVASSHGDGYITDAGTDITAAYWPNVQSAIGLRGGSFTSPDDLLRTSDRTNASGNYFTAMTVRDSTVGFRAVRSVLNTSGFTAGRIFCQNGLSQDTVCTGSPYTITGRAPENAIGKITYYWYISEDNGVTWNGIEGETGADLTYADLKNSTTIAKNYYFRRKALCLVGEEIAQNIVLSVAPMVVKKPIVKTTIYPALGYPMPFETPVVTGLTLTWLFPDGTLHQGVATINTYTAAMDGIYYAYYVNAWGCEGERVAVTLQGRTPVLVKNYGSYRAWDNGTYAVSANDYRNPVLPQLYLGDVGSGKYKIQPMGEVFEVYCDMVTDGGGWTMILDKDIEMATWAAVKNKWEFKPTAAGEYYERITAEGYNWGYWANYYANYKYNAAGRCNWGWNCDDTYAYDWNVKAIPHTKIKISVKTTIANAALGHLGLYNKDMTQIFYVSDSQTASNSWSSTHCGTMYHNSLCTATVNDSGNVYRLKQHYYSSGYNGNIAYLRSIYIK